MEIIYTCPHCGEDLQEYVVAATNPPILIIRCKRCGWEAEAAKEYEKIIRIPYQQKIYPNPCESCSNNPLNGGLGICHCILNTSQITY